MGSTAIVQQGPGLVSVEIERVLMTGDLSKLTPEQRLSYYNATCQSLGLNPLTRPFDYITLNNRLTLNAKRDATDQLRKIHKVSIEEVIPQKIGDLYVVVASAIDGDSRKDKSTGAVNIAGLSGEKLANAMMKAETKAKRRVTLSICGLGVLDETEVDTLREMGDASDFNQEQPERKPPVTQPTRASEKKAAGQTQAAEKPAEKEISGIIEKTNQAKSGTLWVTVKGEPLVIAVDGDKIDGDMVAGNFIKFRGLNKHNDKLATKENPQGQFWSLIGLIELSPVQEGETKAEGKLAPDMAETANEMFGEKKGNAAIEELKSNGSVTTASQLPAKPGAIGKGRAQRLYAIAGQNAKKTGFTEENIKKVLAALYPGQAEYHLSELEKGKYEWFEKLCTGEEKWDEYLPE